MIKDKKKTLLKTLIIFIIYMFYTNIISFIFTKVGFNDTVSTMFISDLIFFFIIVCLYQDNLKKDFKSFINNYNFKQKIWVILKYVVLIFALNMVLGFLTELFIPGLENIKDQNSLSISSLLGVSTFYTLFKTLIFATIAEELLFRESMHECIDNKVAFIIISAIIYATINIFFTNFNSSYVWIDFLAYFLTYMLLSSAYLRNNDNIVVVILIKFFYNLIPTILLLMGAF